MVVKVGSKFKRFGSDGSSLKVALARWALGPINSHRAGRLGSHLNQIRLFSHLFSLIGGIIFPSLHLPIIKNVTFFRFQFSNP